MSAASVTRVLADAPTGEAAKSGPLWAVVVGVLCVGCYFLFKSLVKHLRIVRENFPDDAGGGELARTRPAAAGPPQPGEAAQSAQATAVGGPAVSGPVAGSGAPPARPGGSTRPVSRPPAKDRRRRR